ncbi:serine/threonine protein kinase [Bailinhaonella thermotolerans]|uniref:non-specific serine/threonine protein kinase n=2 Tax=Bailinhaonella thermotolerans TaxID=1070861 RepID=A0A3A4AZM9_9ACTN|nr:serine/threonine protein kinase [Bailinhaonella thermotolerans]
MGEVWRAEDGLLERPVAVKVPRPEHADDVEFRLRFQREARHAAALSHPGVAQVYDYGEGPPRPWLVMEYVRGESLAAILAREGRLAVDRTLDIVAQTAEALAAAHAAGLVHRDVKPGNLLITGSGTVKVTDFGIAWASDATPLTRTGTLVGTPLYLSPEQAAGRAATTLSDIYSLGVIAFQCLSGSPPFVGNPAAVALAHRDQPLPPLPADVPEPVRGFVAALTAKHPGARPGDAHTVAAWARALLAVLPSTAAGPRRASAPGLLSRPGPVPSPRTPGPALPSAGPPSTGSAAPADALPPTGPATSAVDLPPDDGHRPDAPSTGSAAPIPAADSAPPGPRPSGPAMPREGGPLSGYPVSPDGAGTAGAAAVRDASVTGSAAPGGGLPSTGSVAATAAHPSVPGPGPVPPAGEVPVSGGTAGAGGRRPAVRRRGAGEPRRRAWFRRGRAGEPPAYAGAWGTGGDPAEEHRPVVRGGSSPVDRAVRLLAASVTTALVAGALGFLSAPEPVAGPGPAPLPMVVRTPPPDAATPPAAVPVKSDRRGGAGRPATESRKEHGSGGHRGDRAEPRPPGGDRRGGPDLPRQPGGKDKGDKGDKGARDWKDGKGRSWDDRDGREDGRGGDAGHGDSGPGDGGDRGGRGGQDDRGGKGGRGGQGEPGGPGRGADAA